jgi:hypothetical protein
MTDALIEKLAALKSPYGDSYVVKQDVLNIVRQHHAEVTIQNDRVCIAGKWYIPAEGEGDPIKHQAEPISLKKCAEAASLWRNGIRYQFPQLHHMGQIERDAYFAQAKAVLEAAGVAYVD